MRYNRRIVDVFPAAVLTLSLMDESLLTSLPSWLNWLTLIPMVWRTLPQFNTYSAEIRFSSSTPPPPFRLTFLLFNLLSRIERRPSVAAKQAAYRSYCASSGGNKLGIRSGSISSSNEPPRKWKPVELGIVGAIALADSAKKDRHSTARTAERKIIMVNRYCWCFDYCTV